MFVCLLTKCLRIHSCYGLLTTVHSRLLSLENNIRAARLGCKWGTNSDATILILIKFTRKKHVDLFLMNN